MPSPNVNMQQPKHAQSHRLPSEKDLANMQSQADYGPPKMQPPNHG